jgi:tetratricopeptide (TPR) repeat protein
MKKVSCLLLYFLTVTFLLTLPVCAAYSTQAVSYYTSGTGYIENGNYSEAIGALNQAIALEPGYYEAYNAKADALNRNKQYADALAASDRSLALSPEYGKGWINRGYILYNLGRYDEEIKAYEKAVALDPENADAWFNRGYALAGIGEYDEALRSFDTVARINPAYPNLAANRRIAEKNREAATPFHLRYAPWIALAALLVLCIGALAYWQKTKKR